MIVQNKKILFSLLLIFMSIAATAQISAGGGEGPPPPAGGPGTPGFPIDDGLIVLFAVAFIYGVYRSLKHSKKLS